MRYVAVVLALGVVGCTQPVGLSHTSSLTHDTRGVALADNGQGAAGMNSMVCGFDARFGWVFSDWRTDDAVESVLDSRGGTVLASAETGLWRIDVNGFETRLTDQPDVIAASWLSETGVDRVAVRSGLEGCTVERVADGAQSWSVDASLCDSPKMVSDRVNGVTWLANGALYRIDASGVTPMGRAATQLAWDATRGMLLTAVEGETEVVGLDPDGTEVLTMTTDAGVVSIATLGTQDEGIVMTAPENGVGRLNIVSFLDGDVLQTLDVPEPGDLIVDTVGSMMGVVTPTQAHFYNVEYDVPVTALMQPEPAQVEMFD